MSRNLKKSLRRIILLSFFLFIIVGSFFYSKNIATKRITIKNYNYSSTSIPEGFEGFKIGYISDLYIKNSQDVKQLHEIVSKLNLQNCDLVIFGGDLFESSIIEQDQVIKILGNIKASHGKFAVLGEKDFIELDTTVSILENGGFEVLRNTQRSIYYNDAMISLIGLESNTDVASFIKETMNIAIIHEPDYFNELKEQNIDLQLSGHTNGGYVYLPYIGALHKVSNGTLYNHGVYKENGSSLYVSNGLGMESNQNYRFLAPQQIVVVTLQSKTKETK